ncbi:glycosyltransferase family 2 protein [uncultured Streptomyces sp.]|uniref:glycosyltransferase family 2 protein n=1 Tax=uncultured Streptomyces sp. TaxID=174707 RepID=UPI00262DDD5B|nr:galactosyltransferase-related protein [uncultured Streptomyces sp.]
MRVAVITLVSGRHDHLSLQRAGLAAGTRTPDHYVVVTMDDPRAALLVAPEPCPGDPVAVPVPSPGRLPLAAARNAGARRALDAGADLLVFLDVDCVPGAGTLDRYARCAADGALLCGTVSYLPPPPAHGYRLDELPALASPHPARPVPGDDEVLSGGDPLLFWSLSFALTAATWRTVGGFHEEYEGYGGEDTDFAMQAAGAGVELRWLGGAPVHHQYHPTRTPPTQHLDDILRNGALYRRRWGNWPMEGWLRDFARLGLVRHDPRTDTWSAVDRTA